MPSSRTYTCALFFVLALSLMTLFTVIHHYRHRHLPSFVAADYHRAAYYRDAFRSSASNYTVSGYLRDLTLHPHLAGTPPSLSTAVYVQSHFQSLGLLTRMSNFTALLSYPTHASVAARFGNGSVVSVRLSEPNASRDGVVDPYHAYSPSGTAYGRAVFLNYGRERDYAALGAHGVEVKGCVGIVRRGMGLSRYEVVENAAAHGVSAVLMYTESSYKEGVERGTVIKGLGDPLTPNWAGIEGGEKLQLDDPRVSANFPSVPSLPVSEAAAELLLESLEGPRLPYEWKETSSSGGGRIRRVGPGPTMINFTYEGEKKMATIHNVFAVIKGSEEPDLSVLLGNHRDAWTYGAVDPNSGTSALLDIALRLSLLVQSGWKPRRTIVLCSWDAEEFGMIGSTEWVEQNIMTLGYKTVAYFNVDCAVQGPGLFVSATPQLDDLLVEVTKQVKDPDSDGVLYDRWASANDGTNKIQRLNRVDSDFAPFLHHVGVPSIDLYFGADFPVYHTAFDSYEWMVKFGDPSFHRHVAVTEIWGLVALHLADDPVLPFNYISYAAELKEYETMLNNLLKGTISSHSVAAAIQEFTTAAHEAEEEAEKLRAGKPTDESTLLKRRALNDRLILTERAFMDPDGLPTMHWFKHLIYGPVPGDVDTELTYFPGILDTMHQKMEKEEREASMRHEIWRVARAIQRAASALRGEYN